MKKNVQTAIHYLLISSALVWLGIALSLYGENAPNTTSMLLENFKNAVFNDQITISLCMALIAGFFTSLSPCIYPLIPITLSVMGARTYNNPLQGFLVSASYVSGMALVYSTLGAIFASIGMLLGSLMQHPVILSFIALFFIILALSMFGVFNILLPSKLLERLSIIGKQGPKGAFLMGLIAGVLAAPCTGPILGFILTLIASEKNVVFGSTLMLSFSLGLGLPFLVLGTFSSMISHLPKSGVWMENIKRIFGASMLGVALYYLALAFPYITQLLMYLNFLGLPFLLVLLLLSIVMLLWQPFSFKHTFAFHLYTILGIAVSSCAIASLLSLEFFSSSAQNLDKNTWEVIDHNTTDHTIFDRWLSQAKKEHRPVIVDFYADWCVACKELDHKTFKDPLVSSMLHHFLLIRIDTTKTSDYLEKLQNKLKVTGLPTTILINKSGKQDPKNSVIGFISPQPFIKILNKVLSQ